ncbi:prolipoprotein diacylglyceryl transferase [Aquisphaera giovannonii]|uniref:Prolipoprotein diacylglyceryl transferase n=1 Tax=Aquisphaera giovannonii TaxID=406548 RepID=A0A5B9WGH8_9BACT|nr:prolipoprotein diacylglyceryl transferase family protein [Aquisphaera giovannonii]QEH39115.1 prolipoprotein diacylglyceryl transferase [Aquisphaera giovannonii]
MTDLAPAPRPGPAYAAIMLAAIATAALLRRKPDRRLPLPLSQRLGIALGAFCGAMIGAKLPYVLADWEGLKSGAAWLDNGKTILAGLVGGYLGVETAKALLGVTIKTGDSFAVPVAAAVAVGRLACFVGGCCYGKPTSLPWGITFHDGIPRHPTQLYESAFHAGMAVFLAWTERRGLFVHQRIKLYLIAYLAYRFATEYLRPEPVVLLGLTAYQLGALALLPAFAYLWHRDSAAATMAASTE